MEDTKEQIVKTDESGEWLKKIQEGADLIFCKIYLIENIIVDYGKSLHEAEIVAGYHLGDIDQRIQGIIKATADQYPPLEEKTEKEILVLIGGLYSHLSFERALKWAILNNLEKTVPHEIFTLSNKSFSDDTLILETTSSFLPHGYHGSWGIWFHDNRGESVYYGIGDYSYRNVLYAFRKKF